MISRHLYKSLGLHDTVQEVLYVLNVASILRTILSLHLLGQHVHLSHQLVYFLLVVLSLQQLLCLGQQVLVHFSLELFQTGELLQLSQLGLLLDRDG